MRWLLCCGFLAACCAQAAEPSSTAMRSCLLGRSISPHVAVRELPNHEILSQDAYRAGYDAPYYFKVNGKDIGYAERGDNYGIIFSGNIYPLKSARRLLSTDAQPMSFNPNLADWNTVTEANRQYLCVSFNFDGLGRSGSFQNVRGGYLLSIKAANHANTLYFVVMNTRGSHDN